MDAIIGDVLIGRSAAEWVEALNAAGVACGPIYTVDQVFADPQVKLAGLVAETANAAWGPHRVIALPLHLSRTPARVEWAAPMTGEHTRQTLLGLGYDDGAIDALRKDGVIDEHGREAR
jgi:formyl-CoA transferase